MSESTDLNAGQAWEAYRRQDYAAAGELWLHLLREAKTPAEHILYFYQYTYVLLAQGHSQQAYAILQELFEITSDPLYLHQMSFIARMAGDKAVAKARLLTQKIHLASNDHPSLADTAYEQGLLALLQSDLVAASDYAHESLQHALAADNALALGMAHRLLGDVMTALCDQMAAKQHYQAAFLAASQVTSRIQTEARPEGRQEQQSG